MVSLLTVTALFGAPDGGATPGHYGSAPSPSVSVPAVKVVQVFDPSQFECPERQDGFVYRDADTGLELCG